MKVGPKTKAVAATLLGVGPIIVGINAVNVYIYTRAEGKMLEKRIERTETQRDIDSREILEELRVIRQDIKELLRRR